MSENKMNFQGMTFEEMHHRMQAVRTGRDGEGARAITLSEFAKSELGIEVGEMLQKMGVDLDRMTVEAVMAMDPSSRWILPEVFIEAITTGFKARPWYTQLVVRDEPVNNVTIKAPAIAMSESAAPAETDEGETIKEAEMSVSDRDVTIRKLARGIGLTYEAIRYHRLSFLALFLEQFGIKFGGLMNARAVERTVNGDQADGSMAPATIGVASTQDKLSWTDIVRVIVRMSALGYPVDSVIANEDGIVQLLTMEEFKKLMSGNPIIKASLASLGIEFPTNWKFFVHANAGANKFCFGCSSAMNAQATASPLEIEGEKIIRKQIVDTVASITTDIVNLNRTARVIVDQSLAYAGNGFPTWMAAE